MAALIAVADAQMASTCAINVITRATLSVATAIVEVFIALQFLHFKLRFRRDAVTSTGDGFQASKLQAKESQAKESQAKNRRPEND